MESENDSPNDLANDVAPVEQTTIEDAELVEESEAFGPESTKTPTSGEAVLDESSDLTREHGEVPFASVAEANVGNDQSANKDFSSNLPTQFQNVAAKGGAVAAVTLGLLTIFGAFLTQWSIFNAVVGLGLGIWGLSSPLKRTTWVGMGLCLTGLALCVFLYSSL